MYIYLIKYNGEVIAAAENDKYATAVMYQYMKTNSGSDISLFSKEPIRFFGNIEEKVNQ